MSSGLAYERRGDGLPVVLLHGSGSARGVWAPVVARLDDRVATLAVDLPGHGESPPGSATPEEWAGEVADLLAGLGIERPPVIGHSAGG